MGRTGLTEEGEERFWFDIVSAIVLFMTAIGNMLSAGVMLSAGFCHLLADAHRNLLFIGRFPISNFLAATGYIITLLADQVVQFVGEHAHGDSGSSTGAKLDTSGPGAGGAHAGSGATASGGGGSGGVLPLFRNGGYNKLPSTGSELAVLAAAGGPEADGDAAVVSGQEGMLTTVVHRGDGHAHHGNGHVHGKGSRDAEAAAGLLGIGGLNGGVAGAATDGSKTPLLSTAASLTRSHSQGGGGGGECHSAGMAVLLGGGRKLSFATAVLLASALCIHSILEGMALGAQQSMRSTEDIMVAIAAHKGLAAYALGASIMESGASSKRFWTVIGCFSLATPIGIFAGYGMSSSASSKSGSALSALASGTFLYVAFMEVIPKELQDGRHRAAKMAAFLVGYALMSLLAVWACAGKTQLGRREAGREGRRGRRGTASKGICRGGRAAHR